MRNLFSVCFLVLILSNSGFAVDELELHDTLILKSGSQLTGKVVDRTNDNNREFIIFRTNSGAVYKLDIKRLVKRVHTIQPEYKTLLAKMDSNSADDHWTMYEWCKQTDKGGFKREMEFHLRRIVEIDNNDTKAMRLLKYDRFNGLVLNEAHQLSGHGYSKLTGGWVPKQFLNIHQYEKQNEELINSRKIALSKWARQIGRVNENVLSSTLAEIADGYSVGLIYQRALKEKDDGIRFVYVNALSNIESQAAQNALVHFAIRDANVRIREQAASLLEQPHVNKAAVAFKASEFLRDKDRVYLLRAARLIGELGQMSAFSMLLGSLQTTHEVMPGEDPGRMTSTFGNGGQYSFGGKKPVKRTFDNQEVLTALEKITGKTYGYNQEAWKSWYTSTQTIERYNLSGDE